ncbi:hypothetical protein [Psychromonas aquatilis]|uniref:Uncharacterized protein n=1 Tax=Psychromonas aquatilis TaxID=2005072 RepID=A0ABU9GNI2_9GAMM
MARDDWKAREADFYLDLQVSKYLPVIGQSKEYDAPNDDLYYSGWNYDSNTLKLLGLDNITTEDGELFNEKIDAEIPVWQISLTKQQIKDFTW